MGTFGKLEFRNQGKQLVIPRSARSTWKWFSAELVNLPSAQLEFRLTPSAAYLAVHDIVRSDGETTLGGEAYSTRKDLRDRLTFVPPGCSADGWSAFSNQNPTVLALHITPPPDDGVDISNIPPSLYFDEANLKTSLWKFRSIVEHPDQYDVTYAETLALLIVWELRFALLRTLPSQSRLRGGLTNAQLGRVHEFIVANIAKEISLSDLADIAGLSLFHFARSFKQSVGISPYQYVLRERVDNAKDLLKGGHESLEEIALAAGFRDPLHFNRMFRKVVGVTPTVFRRTNV